MTALPVIAAGIIAAAAGLAVFGIVSTVASHWSRIREALRSDPPTPPAERWRRVHLAADRRAPFARATTTPGASTERPHSVANPSRATSRLASGQRSSGK